MFILCLSNLFLNFRLELLLLHYAAVKRNGKKNHLKQQKEKHMFRSDIAHLNNIISLLNISQHCLILIFTEVSKPKHIMERSQKIFLHI